MLAGTKEQQIFLFAPWQQGTPHMAHVPVRQIMESDYIAPNSPSQTVSHPENPRSSSNLQATSDPNACEMRWHGI